MGALKAIGAVLIVAWLILLALKITVVAVHLLLLVGLAMLLVGFLRKKGAA
jgi:hypothetical protein